MNFADIFAAVAKGADWYEEFLNTFLPSLDADIAALLGRGAVSSTSFSIGTGSKTFPDLAPATLELPVDMRVRIRRRGDPATYMLGAVTASAAGSVTVSVDAVGGAGGPYTDWLITADVVAVPARMTSRAVTASGTVTSADLGGIVYCTGTDTLAFDPVATLGDAFWTVVANISGTRTLNPDGSEQIEDASTIALSANQAVVVAVVAGELRVIASKGYGSTTPSLQVYPTIQTGNFNAASGYIYMVNTAGGAVVATLDASPSQGAQVAFIDATGTFGTNNLTLSRNGNTIDGSAANFVCNMSGLGHTLDFNDTANDWRVR